MKEYLKMADAFPHAKVGKSPVKPWGSGEYFVFYENQAEYAAHAINSHDELVAEVERLRVMVSRMQTYLDMAGEYPEQESDNPVRRWLFDAIDCTK